MRVPVWKLMPAALAFCLMACHPAAAKSASFLRDDFSGPVLNPNNWFIPTHDPAGDGTFVGRTQFRATQDSPPPEPSGGKICPSLRSYNPNAHSFYGTEVISQRLFAVGKGLDIAVRARMTNADHRGVVGGIFLYYLKPGSDTVHDEIDFELLTNAPDKVQTNIYGEEPLGLGHSQMIPYRHGTIADEHVYEIDWLPGRVSWLVDGEVVRTTTDNLPSHPMNFYLNIWAPDPGWPEGYSESIQPARSKEADMLLGALCVDSVIIKPL